MRPSVLSPGHQPSPMGLLLYAFCPAPVALEVQFVLNVRAGIMEEEEAKARVRKAALMSVACGGPGQQHLQQGQRARGEALSWIDPSVNPLLDSLQGQPTTIPPLCSCTSMLCSPPPRPPSRAWGPHILPLPGGSPEHLSPPPVRETGSTGCLRVPASPRPSQTAPILVLGQPRGGDY